jgi:hypothetical protein
MAPQSTAFIGAVFTIVAASATAQTPSHTVTVADGLVSVDASQAPLSAVFDSLVSRGLVEVTGADRLSGVVAIQLEARPVKAAVTALLADYNFIITTRPRPGDSSGPLVLVLVHSRSAAALTGPITTPELEAVRVADQQTEAPDPDAEPDPETSSQFYTGPRGSGEAA